MLEPLSVIVALLLCPTRVALIAKEFTSMVAWIRGLYGDAKAVHVDV